MFQTQDETSRIYVVSETTKFVDSVRNIGYISPATYKDFVKKLAQTQNLYSIKMEHWHLKVDPVYTDPALESTFQDDFSENYALVSDDDIRKTITPDYSVGSFYKMSAGDYFSVLVYNTNKTFATRIQEMLFQTQLNKKKIVVNYGGAVKNEADWPNNNFCADIDSI